MARSNGSHRSNRRGPGGRFGRQRPAPAVRSDTPPSSSSDATPLFRRYAYSSVRRRPEWQRGYPQGGGILAGGQTALWVIGGLGLVDYRAEGTNTFQPVVISDGEGETDDDFHTTPPEPPRIPRMPTEGPNPAIKLRGGPRKLVTLVASLTQRQRQDVISIGMEGLLSLQVTEMPQLLGHWLVAHFEPATMSLKLGNGRYISITAQDVAHVLGLPNGPVPITERDGQLVGTELRAWREETKQRKGKITRQGV
nr:uncharacterized protein LOC109160869 [Ipomoea batatas]